MTLGQRHLAVRTRPYRRPRPNGWRILVAVGLMAAIGYGGYTLFLHIGPTGAGQVGTLMIRDAYTGNPLPGARVTLVSLACADQSCHPAEITGQGGIGRAFIADSHGAVRARLQGARVTLSALQKEYETRQMEIAWPPTGPVQLALRPTWLAGRITASGEPLANITVQAMAADNQAAASTTTDADGRYRLTAVPNGASLVVDAPNFSRRPHPIERRTTMDLALRPDVVTGTVRDPAGQPVAGLTIAAAGAIGQTAPDGTFRLTGVDEDATLIVKGAGYATQRIPLGASLTQDVTVQPFIARGIYLQAPVAADPVKLKALTDLVAAHDLNTMVIDLKDNNGYVYYDSQVPLAREVGAVQPVFSAPELLQTLHSKGVYVIGRIVVMEDPIAAVKRPDLAIKDARTGKVWRTPAGQPWLNPTNPTVWEYISDLGREAAGLGFDEVQFDYVRFPSDGALNATEYGPAFHGGEQERREAIKGFLTTARAKLAPTPALMGADIFGITAWLKNDNGIGQQFEDLAALLDVICPMDYPSHFNRGFNGWDIPNNYPYEVIKQSLIEREKRVPGIARKTRPWLQAFTYGPGVAYGAAQVQAQIRACNEMQSSGYLLWNAGSEYDPTWLSPKPGG